MTSKILITGTAGFIGYHLAQKLLKLGNEVVGYDSLTDYYPVSVKKARLGELKVFGKAYTHIEGDLCDYQTLNRAFSDYKPEIVCNLAAQAGVRYSLAHPHAYQQSNLEGFLNILECCRHHNAKRLVYASSSSVYGGNKKLPFSESDEVDSPISLYAATKKANELMAHSYTHLYGLQTIGLRFFTVYGPWGRPDMAMWIFAEKILHKEPIPVFNKGHMKRDFTYIDDIVSGVTSTLFNDNLEPYEMFNLGNHQCENLLDMIKLIEESLATKAILDFLPMQPGDVLTTFADIERSRTKLNYSPGTSISSGIPRFCQWYMNYAKIGETVKLWRDKGGNG